MPWVPVWELRVAEMADRILGPLRVEMCVPERVAGGRHERRVMCEAKP